MPGTSSKPAAPRIRAFTFFLATGLRRGNAELEREEQDLVTREFTLSEVERMIRDGEIKDATTVAAFGSLRLKACCRSPDSDHAQQLHHYSAR